MVAAAFYFASAFSLLEQEIIIAVLLAPGASLVEGGVSLYFAGALEVNYLDHRRLLDSEFRVI